jgi:cobalt transporter subunit CbtB
LSQETCRTKPWAILLQAFLGLTEGDMTAILATSAKARLSNRAIGAIVMLFGIALTYGVGLAQNEHLHNAAHDTRHSIGFPCH